MTTAPVTLDQALGPYSSDARVHIAGPVEEDGFQRCLRCDVEFFGPEYKLGQLVLVDGEKAPRKISKRHWNLTRPLACTYTSVWRPAA